MLWHQAEIALGARPRKGEREGRRGGGAPMRCQSPPTGTKLRPVLKNFNVHSGQCDSAD